MVSSIETGTASDSRSRRVVVLGRGAMGLLRVRASSVRVNTRVELVEGLVLMDRLDYMAMRCISGTLSTTRARTRGERRQGKGDEAYLRPSRCDGSCRSRRHRWVPEKGW
jgi:hypothetical protein